MTTTDRTYEAALAAERLMRQHGTKPGGDFMTPEVIEHGMIAGRDVAYELSKGSGITPGSTIYGVSFWGPGGRDPEGFESQCCFSLDEARAVLAHDPDGDDEDLEGDDSENDDEED